MRSQTAASLVASSFELGQLEVCGCASGRNVQFCRLACRVRNAKRFARSARGLAFVCDVTPIVRTPQINSAAHCFILYPLVSKEAPRWETGLIHESLQNQGINYVDSFRMRHFRALASINIRGPYPESMMNDRWCSLFSFPSESIERIGRTDLTKGHISAVYESVLSQRQIF